MLSRVTVVIFSLSAQLGDELPGRALQGGGATLAAVAREPATELADGGDDQVRQGIIGERGGELVQLGGGQARR